MTGQPSMLDQNEKPWLERPRFPGRLGYPQQRLRLVAGESLCRAVVCIDPRPGDRLLLREGFPRRILAASCWDAFRSG